MPSPLFADHDVPEVPSAISTDTFKKDGIYIGEGIIKRVLKNGKYLVTTHENKNISSRAVSNIGENILPKGIAVFVITYNAEGFILGKVRATKDEAKDSGDTETDKSTTIGTEGDTTLKPQSTNDDNITAEVTVTRGGVVKLKSTGATGITLHPHGERIIQKCQTLLAFTDAYRIESGRITTKAGVLLTALTAEAYKDKVGPARTEVRIKNGFIDVTTSHQFSVDTLVTAGGKTTGTSNFKWTVNNTGTWQILNTLGIKFGDLANEPVVLGAQLVSLLKALISNMTNLRNEVVTAFTEASTKGVAAVTPGSGGPAIASALGPSIPKIAATVPDLTAHQATFLTPAGASKELILSDFFSTQKLPPIPGVIAE